GQDGGHRRVCGRRGGARRRRGARAHRGAAEARGGSPRRDLVDRTRRRNRGGRPVVSPRRNAAGLCAATGALVVAALGCTIDSRKLTVKDGGEQGGIGGQQSGAAGKGGSGPGGTTGAGGSIAPTGTAGMGG